MNDIPFALNGRFLMQQVTGVQRVAREALMVFDRMAAEGQITAPRLLLPARGELVAMPELRAIRPERVGTRGGHLWEQMDLPAHCGAEPLLCLGNTAPIKRLFQKGRPVVTMVHDLSYKYFPAAYSWKFRALYGTMMPLILKRSDRVVTVSRAEELSIEKHYPELQGTGRLSYLQNGGIPDHDATVAFANPVPGADARGYGIYVGSLTKRKNAPGVLRGAIEFLKRYPKMRFVVIGSTGTPFEGVDVEIPEEVKARLEFRGQINDAQKIYDAFRRARFLLFPSFYEASPLPPIEAMTFGCPVISSGIPSLTERCGDAALHCEPDDPDSIQTAITALMEEPGLWEAKSAASLEQAARYSWQTQALGLLKLCEAVR